MVSVVHGQLQGAVLHVGNLDRAVDFYTGLLELKVVHRTAEAAVLADQRGTCTLAIRERAVQHYTDRTVEALMWRLPSLDMLTGVERRLDSMEVTSSRHELPDDETTLLTTHDADGQRLLFIHHAGGPDVPHDIPPEVFWY